MIQSGRMVRISLGNFKSEQLYLVAITHHNNIFFHVFKYFYWIVIVQVSGFLYCILSIIIIIIESQLYI